MSAPDRPTPRGATAPQVLALVVGAVYTITGIAGFFVTGVGDFFGHHGDRLLGFMVNPFHNVVHLLVGVAGLTLARTLGGARTYGWLLAVGYGAAFVYGLVAVGRSWDVLDLNGADNWLHLVSALVGLAIALVPVQAAARARTTRV
ncbi:DUF4383 domain-containing protein [Geodermatophilus sp. TF02-6]|uniref:DUF4383 domain-containing protein n=1 Tax=Geodermatophilus sp. TF02-6 TaxID=2250575 RepID=UPI000DEA4255|nr:DUF4383 domain-containing protein [Geodermatophilus sp. TF02-6]RBY75533.1 DUF4383 domain-containing protein [Geodermatophilus sp. TF02-6]